MPLRVEALVATDTASAAAAEGRRAKDDVWVAEEGDMSGASAGRPLLFRTMKVKGSILHPYRSMIIPHSGFHTTTIPLSRNKHSARLIVFLKE